MRAVHFLLRRDPRRNQSALSLFTTREVDRGAWDAFVGAHPSGHFFQSWDWGVLQSALDARAVRIAAISDSNAIVGAAQLLIFEGSRRFAVVPRGPVVDPSNEPAFAAIVDGMLRTCAEEGVQLLRLEPQWTFDPAIVDRLQQSGFAEAKRHIMPPRTILVDLEPEPDAIWEAFSSNTRNRVRLAEKRGVEVRVGTEADVAAFIALSDETAARQGLKASNPDMFGKAAELFGRRDAMRLYLGCDGGAVLAGIMVFVWGNTATYLWGASSASERARWLNPNQLLHWKAMQWARTRNCAVYDFFGIPDFDEETLEKEYATQTGGWWNLYKFKRGFGGRVHRHLGTCDCRIAAT
jgi:lipid II:glycine glycyltransferase (peptidoglycan interpeptide bridge formation enzyme)